MVGKLEILFPLLQFFCKRFQITCHVEELPVAFKVFISFQINFIVIKDLLIFKNLFKCHSVVRACVLCCFSPVQLCDPLDCSPPGFSVRGILQARILSRSPCPSPRDLPSSEIKPAPLMSGALAGRFFTAKPLGKPIVL